MATQNIKHKLSLSLIFRYLGQTTLLGPHSTPHMRNETEKRKTKNKNGRENVEKMKMTNALNVYAARARYLNCL